MNLSIVISAVTAEHTSKEIVLYLIDTFFISMTYFCCSVLKLLLMPCCQMDLKE